LEKLVLYQEDLDRLTELLADMPFRYAKPIWDFFAILIKERKESKDEKVKETEEEVKEILEI